ncbi:MAG: ThuA domain-containing protein [Chloroflexi bacterium]|nr:ThuA domain-containing protein [Chloroflexota bacterium]
MVRGGWQGHEPGPVSEIFAKALRERGFEVEISDTLDAFRDLEKLKRLHLIVPIWTMGHIEKEQLNPLLEAVRSGVGIAGVHGGMGDAFRQETEYQYMVGGQWVAHPGGDGVEYVVHIEDVDSPITAGMHDFTVRSEHYYMHVDPGNHVLATTRFGDTVMPVAWTKKYGRGRVFYCSLGHVAQVFEQDPQILEMVVRGMVWAAEGAVEAAAEAEAEAAKQ